MSSTSRGVHPEITSLIRKRDEIHSVLYTHDYAPGLAIQQMIGLLFELEEKDQDEEIIEDLMKKFHFLSTMASQTNRNIHGKAMKPVLWGLMRKINKILWDGDYLTNEKYRGITPAETLKKEKTAPDEKPFPERLPEDLE